MKSLFRRTLLLLMVGLIGATSAWANDNYYWNVQSGADYVDNANNWLLEGVVPSVYPGDDDPHDDYIYVNTPGTMLIDSSHTFFNNEQVNVIYTGDASGGGHIIQSGSDVRFRYYLIVGTEALAGSDSYYELSGGTLKQVGGSDSGTIGGKGSNGYLTISGGDATTPTLFDLTSSSAIRIGYEKGIGGLTIKDYGKAALGDELRLGYGKSTAGYPTCNGTISMEGHARLELTSTSRDQYVGRYANGTGLFEMIDDTVATISGDDLFVGREGATGEFKMSGNAVATVAVQNLAFGQEGGTGTLTMSGSSSATFTGEHMYVARYEGATGYLNLSGDAVATFDTGGDILYVADGGTSSGTATGTINLSGNATLNANQVNVADSVYNQGTINVTDTADLITTGSIYIGVQGDATTIAAMNVSLNGKVNTNNKSLSIGRGGSKGTVTILDDAVVTVGDYIRFGDDGTAILNLDGGTLACDLIDTRAGTSALPTVATLNFNGGTLKAIDSNPDIIIVGTEYVTQTLNVKAGGAVIDTNTFDIGINQALVEDAVSTGGGLTKNGLGMLTLGGDANTYTGDTVVATGTLGTTSNAKLSDTGSLRIADGAVMDLSFTGSADLIGALYLDGAVQGFGTWGATGSGAANIDDTYFSGTGMVQVVPEPSMLALLAGLSILLTGVRRRRA